jgi:hypothetical protein
MKEVLEHLPDDLKEVTKFGGSRCGVRCVGFRVHPRQKVFMHSASLITLFLWIPTIVTGVCLWNLFWLAFAVSYIVERHDLIYWRAERS